MTPPGRHQPHHRGRGHHPARRRLRLPRRGVGRARRPQPAAPPRGRPPPTLVPDGDDTAVLRGPALPRRPAPARRPLRGPERSAAGDLEESATEAMGALLALTAGGTLPEVVDGTAVVTRRLVRRRWSPTTSASPARRAPAAATPSPTREEQAVPDALVGLAWPAVFACIGAVEGLLDLVHLDHRIDVGDRCRPRPAELQHRRHPRRCRGHHGRPGDQRRRAHQARRRRGRPRRHAARALHGARPHRLPPSWPPRPRWRTHAKEKPPAPGSTGSP